MNDNQYNQRNRASDNFKKKQRNKAPLNLLPHRKYWNDKGIMRRVRNKPNAPIMSVIQQLSTGMLMHYTPSKELVPVSGSFSSMELASKFHSRTQAKKALWHGVQNSGIPNGHEDFVIIPV